MDKTYFSKHIPVYVGEVGHDQKIPIIERINCMKDFMKEVTAPNRSCTALLHNDGTEGKFKYWNFRDIFNKEIYLKWNENEYIDTFIYGVQGKEYPLSEDFIKKNEVKIESIVGKNLLNESYKQKTWNAYQILSTTFYGSTPEKYKLVIELEKTGSEPILELAYEDLYLNWHNGTNTASLKNLKVKGGTLLNGPIKVKDNIVEISINEKLARELANCENVYISGNDILLKSVKVME